MLDTVDLSFVRGKSVAIKMHVGRRIGYSTIPALFVRDLVRKLHELDARPFITDQSVADARVRGYTEELLGCPIVDVCGLLGKYYYEKSVSYRDFTHVDVGGHIYDADCMIDLSHVKGHGACGLGGACKNIAMGCVTDRTRSEIHHLEGGISWDEAKCTRCEACVSSCNHGANKFNKNGEYEVFFHHCTFCGHCVKVCPTGAIAMDEDNFVDFQTGMAVCTKAVCDTFTPGSIYYINFLTHITALCDCWGLTTPALVPDIGILASNDIVAIEKASLDLIKVEDLIPAGVPQGHELGDTGHLFERLHHKNPYIQLEKLVEHGMGSMNYHMVEVS